MLLLNIKLDIIIVYYDLVSLNLFTLHSILYTKGVDNKSYICGIRVNV